MYSFDASSYTQTIGGETLRALPIDQPFAPPTFVTTELVRKSSSSYAVRSESLEIEFQWCGSSLGSVRVRLP
jgi:hypothetical protein